MIPKDQGLVNLADGDLDQKVYRIYGLDRFKALLSSRQDALINPSMWDDPFENFLLEKTEVRDNTTGTAIPLKNLAGDWYGQCWSLNEETYAMWRIYSPDRILKSGVKVRTTIRKIYDNLKRIGPPEWPLQFYVGKIEYINQDDIRQLMGNITFAEASQGGQGRGFAELMCVKREAFKHENEVRILFQDTEIPQPYRAKLGVGGIMNYDVDPNRIFDEVILDPRLSDTDSATIKNTLSRAGCRLNIEKSALYDSPRFTIPMS